MKIEIPKVIERAGGDLISNIIRLIDSRLSNIHTTTIGVIESFDAETQTAVIQPAIKRVTAVENKDVITYESGDNPLLVNVPVVFPGGGDWFMTFPVKQGDECLIFSMERSIGKWKKNGGVQDPSNFKRKLSFKDAVAMVGIQSKASSLPSFNEDEPEIRNRDGDVKLTMTADGMTLMDGADNAVRYSALETAYNQLKTDFDSLVTKYNTDMTTIAEVNTAAISGTGFWPANPKLVIGGASPSTGDITGAKVDEFLIP